MNKTAAVLKRPMTKQEELTEMVRLHEKKVLEMEKELVEFALKHNVTLYLGEYGNGGRSLALSYDEYTDKKRGEWIYSSESC